jgi:hypothetical protein
MEFVHQQPGPQNYILNMLLYCLDSLFVFNEWIMLTEFILRSIFQDSCVENLIPTAIILTAIILGEVFRSWALYPYNWINVLIR